MLISPAALGGRELHGFIVLEGVNGAGKTTLQQKIVEYFTVRGRPVLATREPGSTELGKQLRRVLLEGETPVTPAAEVLLFGADRAEHVAKVIRPALADGRLVVSDRYYYSTVAFQGYGRGINLEQIAAINEIAVSGVLPDLTVLLDLDPRTGLARARGRENADEVKDAFEKEALAFQERMRAGFLAIAEECPEPVIVLDARKEPAALFAELEPALRLF